MQKMRLHAAPESTGIVILVPGFPGNEAETDCLPPVQNFVRVLAERNPQIAIDVVSFQYPFQARIYSWHGATVHAIAGGSKRFPWRLSSWIRASWCVYRLMRTRRVIAVHSMWLAECTYVASWISRLSGIRHIASIRGQDALPENPYLKHLPLNRMTITAGSEPAAAVFERSTGRKVNLVLPSGLDKESLNPGAEPADRSMDILGVGSLSSIKDFGSFVEIVAQLRPHHPNLQAMIIGEGPERQALEVAIRRLRLEGNIRLVGRIAREEVLRVMRKSKVLLHTSRFEGQGYVLLEALGSGMQVVCRDVGYTGDSDGVFRCESDEKVVSELNRLLSSTMSPLNPNVLSMDETVRAFERLYMIGD